LTEKKAKNSLIKISEKKSLKSFIFPQAFQICKNISKKSKIEGGIAF